MIIQFEFDGSVLSFDFNDAPAQTTMITITPTATIKL